MIKQLFPLVSIKLKIIAQKEAYFRFFHMIILHRLNCYPYHMSYLCFSVHTYTPKQNYNILTIII